MTQGTIIRTSQTEAIKPDALAIHTISTTKAGKVRSVREYVNIETGEIIPAEQLRIPALDLREKLPARSAALGALRHEVRKFAEFILQFANKRRGITPGIDTLCQWYAELHGRQAGHIRRYIKPLTEAGILAGESLLGTLFQRTGGRARDHLGEEFHGRLHRG